SRLRCMPALRSRKFHQSLIARWPPLARFDRRAFHLANRDHLARVRFSQLAPADKPSALADLGQIFAHMFLRFCHSQFQTYIISGLRIDTLAEDCRAKTRSVGLEKDGVVRSRRSQHA